MPTFGSLFAGIGGIDLGLERAGWECRWQVEWDPFCQHVLAHHWPDITRYGDITAVDWSGVERVDLLAGGFPCQPQSRSGKQEAQSDPRWLWPEFARAIRVLRPRLVLVENVTGLLDVNDGTAFGDVLGDLAASGYDAEWDCLPASAFGAPHDRDRVWVAAYATGERSQALHEEPRVFRQQAAAAWFLRPTDGADAHGGTANGRRPIWATEPAVRRVDDGIPYQMERTRALGNAVVPQVVEVIGRQLLEAM